jgi:iron(III) transport system substrate-binding protein
VLPKDRWPDSIHDLTDADWKGKVGIAKPLFGTTATHAAVLFSHWGDEQAKEFFRTLAQNAQILSGNKQIAEAVASGELAFGLTDTDDAIIEKEDGMPVEIVFPDQGDDQMGTLLIPNTLCLIKGSPHPEQSRRLIDYLFSAEVESRLAEGRSAQFPLHADAPSLPRVAPDEPTKWMDVDFNSAADRWETAAKFLSEEFGGE